MSFDDELRGAFARADTSIERVPLDWTATLAKARRSRRVYLAALAVGAAVALTVGTVGARSLLLAGTDRDAPPVTQPDDPSPVIREEGGRRGTASSEDEGLLFPPEPIRRGCSAAEEAKPTSIQIRLPEPVKEMRAQIIYAAWNCDYNELSALAKDLSFNFNNQAVSSYADYWRDLEAAGTPFTATLVRVLALPHARVDQLFVWPSAFGPDATDSDFEALVESGLYTRAEADEMQRNGYLGPRIGIRRNGDWQFYVEGGD